MYDKDPTYRPSTRFYWSNQNHGDHCTRQSKQHMWYYHNQQEWEKYSDQQNLKTALISEGQYCDSSTFIKMWVGQLLLVCFGITTASSSECSSVINGMIIGAGNYQSMTESSADSCCASCEEDENCLAWTWESDNNNCYLKNDIFYRFQSENAVSGLSGRPSPYGNGSIARACSTNNTSAYPFCDSTLDTQTRVNDLISRLTLDEKAAMLTARESPAGDVSRLGVPEYDWGANCIHGVQSRCALADENGVVRCPTTFPNPIGLASAFNFSLWQQMGTVIGLELRSLWLQGVGENHDDNLPHLGLDCWSPNINIARDPRWGRILETTGEDPMLSGQFGKAYTIGLQNNEDEPRYLQGVATMKHFAAYSLEDYEGVTRHTFDAEISDYNAATTYFPSWRASVGGVSGARGVMCSYNEVNGIPSCANEWLLQRVLRGDVSEGGFGFDGYVTSDSGAVEDIYSTSAHAYVPTGEEGIGLAFNATCDVDSSLDNGHADTGSPYTWYMNSSIDQGYLEEAVVDGALNRSLWMRFAMGLFDEIEDQPLWQVSPDVVSQNSHVTLNQEATRQSLVLLRNDNNSTLPFNRGLTVAVIGPHANATQALTGNYLGQICPEGYNDFSCVETPFDAIAAANTGGVTGMALGCDVACEDDVGFSEALNLAENADIVVLMMGIDTSTVEKEGKDRETISLPGKQQDLATQIIALDKPTSVVLLHGGALGVDFLCETSPLALTAPAGVAVMSAFYPGPIGSSIIAEALFGDFSPSGRLPYTMFGADYINEADFLSMDLPPNLMTYKYYLGSNALWPFAHGLSYATFDYNLNYISTVSFDSTDESAVINLDILISRTDNIKTIPSAQLSLTAFIRPLTVNGLVEGTPLVLSQLVTFNRTEDLALNDEFVLSLEIVANDFALADSDGDVKLFPGVYTLEIWDGTAAPRITTDIVVGGYDVRLVIPFPR